MVSIVDLEQIFLFECSPEFSVLNCIRAGYK